jgi:Pyrimidine dimer DNA glycosylase
MQTFMPYPDYLRSAGVLDYRRLGKQRVEAKQVLLALTNPDYGWQHHPATNMWRGHESELAAYGLQVCVEWVQRGYKDSLRGWFLDQYLALPPSSKPSWFGDPAFHVSHQSNLLRKDPVFYGPLFPGVPDDLPYLWPVTA